MRVKIARDNFHYKYYFHKTFHQFLDLLEKK
jgi:hypothetical protein